MDGTEAASYLDMQTADMLSFQFLCDYLDWGGKERQLGDRTAFVAAGKFKTRQKISQTFFPIATLLVPYEQLQADKFYDYLPQGVGA